MKKEEISRNHNIKYIHVAEQAKMIRKTLKEAFPGVKIRVRSKSYSGGASITVWWIDGPSEETIKKTITQFEGGYFDGMTDYKGGYVKRDNETGENVSFSGDFIFTEPCYSEKFLLKAIIQFHQKYERYPQIEIEKTWDNWAWSWNIPSLIDGKLFQETCQRFRAFLTEYHKKNGCLLSDFFKQRFEIVKSY